KKYFAFQKTQIKCITPAPRANQGTYHDRHDTLGAGCDGRCGVRQFCCPTKRKQRTAKSCGPGAATVPSIHAGLCWRGNGDKKRRSPGRARISRKAIAWGKPGCLGCTCQSRVRSLLPIAHGAAGAVGARLSLRPLE